MLKPVRLDKFLADSGAGTRSEVKNFIRKGLVTVNGAVVSKPECKVLPEDEVALEGKTVSAAPEFVYYLLNKPAGYVSAVSDKFDPTVMELIHSSRKGLSPVGRLDKDTEGLLLITDDGALSHELLSPKKHIDKTYFVRVVGDWKDTKLKFLETGVDIGDDKITLPAKAEKVSEAINENGEHVTELLLTIHEGRYHQVKRMLLAVGCKVIYLKRISMGSLKLPEDLRTGEARELTLEEITALKALIKKQQKNM